MNTAANCDWQTTVQQSPTTGEWFGDACLPGTRTGDNFDGKRIHTDWFPTQLGAQIALDSLLSMQGNAT